MNKQLDEAMAALIATTADLLDVWKNQVTPETQASIVENYPKYLPVPNEFLQDLQSWRYQVQLEEAIKAALKDVK